MGIGADCPNFGDAGISQRPSFVCVACSSKEGKGLSSEYTAASFAVSASRRMPPPDSPGVKIYDFVGSGLKDIFGLH